MRTTVRTVTKSPKFSWEAPSGGPLRITVTTGPRQVSWDIRKTTPPDKLRGMLGEIMTELATEAEPWPADYNPLAEMVSSGATYGDHVEYVPGPEALAQRAESLNTGANWFKLDEDSLDDIPMYEPKAKE